MPRTLPITPLTPEQLSDDNWLELNTFSTAEIAKAADISVTYANQLIVKLFRKHETDITPFRKAVISHENYGRYQYYFLLSEAMLIVPDFAFITRMQVFEALNSKIKHLIKSS